MIVSKSIEKRRDEIRKAHAEYVKNMPDPDQPPGHRKLAEEERQKTLSLLQDSKLIIHYNQS